VERCSSENTKRNFNPAAGRRRSPLSDPQGSKVDVFHRPGGGIELLSYD